MSFDWNKYTETSGSQYVSFKEVGDQVVGRIVDIREGADFNRNPCPELVLDVGNGGSMILTAGQKVLQAELALQAPNVGDRIRITYTGTAEAQPGRTPAKLFTVDVKPAAQIEADESPF